MAVVMRNPAQAGADQLDAGDGAGLQRLPQLCDAASTMWRSVVIFGPCTLRDDGA
ncbi:hypothetical protein [Mesorhizobium sp.]|uniref:hypothetical protein n=1 Tax=Mesorhizobium sp. TaxID=1871066 RepID=UPI00257F636D|nr:hypothetical protein [Mesorhizobium sp.]